jgi:lipoprotein Spr
MIMTSCGSTKHVASSRAAPVVSQNAESKKLRQKYAGLIGVPPEQIANLKLYRFIDSWMGTPYAYGGNTKSGIDCSGFAEQLQFDVYGKKICCSAAEIFEHCTPVKQNNLQEGDLVFFRINGNSVSHVGVYLSNEKFVHASTQLGVVISSLKEPYYQRYYYRAGRIN